MSASFDLEAPEHFTAGAVGAPGQRVFYLQAAEGPALVTLKAEKEQVRALGEYLSSLLARVGKETPAAAREVDLREPLEAAWPVASIGVGYDEEQDRIVVVASEAVEEEEEEGKTPEAAAARFAITRAQAAAFVARAQSLMKAGRPPCPICSRPLDPEGHVCPRANGHASPSA